MQRTLLIILVFAVLVAIFALQNSAEVVIKLWFWSIETSVALVVVLTFAAGALMGILFSIPRRKKKKVRDEAAEIPLEVNPHARPDEDDDPEFEDLSR
jgi:uncharacterized integral membrane protein